MPKDPNLWCALAVLFLTIGFAVHQIRSPNEPSDIDRARFLIECVEDYQYKPETCEGILDGALPPPRPDHYLEPGC